MTTRDSWFSLAPRTAIAVAITVVAAAPVLAQNTTAGIAGRVTGDAGQPVAGATVTVVHLPSNTTTTATTDADGRWAARGLRTGGPYTVTVARGGQTERREGLSLALAETTTLDLALGAAPSQTVNVTGRGDNARFDRGTMGAGTAVGSRELAALPSLQRNLQDYARLDPRISQTDKANGSISAGGQNNRFNSITIDGVTTNDTFGLEANNLPTKKQPISIDAIQSVQINLSNYDITQKGYTGANVNAVTKSGTNEFHGSVYYVARNDNLVGRFFNRQTGAYSDFAPFKENTKGFTLGGPIVQDRLFFFGGYEEFTTTKAAPAFGPAGSSLANVGITPQAIASAVEIARTTYGFDAGSPDVPGNLALKVKDALFKLDWNISDDHRASVRYSKTQQSDPVITNFFGANQLSLSSYWYVTDKTVDSLVGQWFADWTPTFSTELKVAQRDYSQRHTPVNGTRLPSIGLSFAGALPGEAAGASSGTRTLNFGTELSRQFNVLDTKTLDLYAAGNLALGAHELKFGVDRSDNEIYNAFLQNVNGNYTFGCENSSAAVTYSFGAITCSSASAAQVQAAVLENFRLGRPNAFTVQLPRAGRTLDDGVARLSIATTGVFVQDSWTVSPSLSLTLGLRVDQQSVPDAPLANAAVAVAPMSGGISGTTYTRASGGFGIDNTVTLDGSRLWQPRLGFNWKLGSDSQRRQLRGGIGLFQGAAASVWLTNPYSNTGAAVAQYNCASFTACAAAGARFGADPAAQPTLTGNPPAANVDALSPNLQQPSVWKANLAFEAELPAWPIVGGLVAGVEWLHTRVDSGIFYQHLNLGAPTRTGSDGRDLFYRPEGLNRDCYSVSTNGSVQALTAGACATPTGQTRTRALSNPNFANVLLARETDKGGGNAVTLSLTRPVSQGFGWGIGYTRTSAKEVSPLTSSTSNSNWNTRNIFNPNEETLQNSNYLIRDRFSGNLSFSRAFVADYRTTLGVFYEGRRGKPYSWTYINDLNGDGISGNDLMYIPSAPGAGEVVFRGGAAEEGRFWDIVNAQRTLSSARGGVVGRNNAFAPWVNTFDMRLSQELPGFAKGHKVSFVLDFLNVGNLLNKKWGRIDEIDFPSRRSFVNFAGLDANGRYIYSLNTASGSNDFITRQSERESQWAIQATLRYEF